MNVWDTIESLNPVLINGEDLLNQTAIVHSLQIDYPDLVAARIRNPGRPSRHIYSKGYTRFHQCPLSLCK